MAAACLSEVKGQGHMCTNAWML